MESMLVLLHCGAVEIGHNHNLQIYLKIIWFIHHVERSFPRHNILSLFFSIILCVEC